MPPKKANSILGKRAKGAEPTAAIPEPNESVPSKDDWEVYKDEENKFFNAYLMQADMDKNANKYYIVQLLKHKTQVSRYSIFTKYGRVGKVAA